MSFYIPELFKGSPEFVLVTSSQRIGPSTPTATALTFIFKSEER
jgi:hypothetical protein